MTPLTDELLGRRLADRATRTQGTSLTALARSASARPQARRTGLVGRWAAVGSVAAAVVVGVVLVGGLLSRVYSPGSANGSASATLAVGSRSPSDPPNGIAAWTSIAWEKTSPSPFESDETFVNDAIAVADGFIAVGTTRVGGRLTGRVWRSPDGRSWERIDDPGIATFVPARVLTVGGTLVVLGDLPPAAGDRVKNVELWHSEDGRTWTRGPTLPVPGDAGPAAGGDAGILLPIDHDTYLIGPDLVSWNKTTTWPADVYLGSPTWANGLWIQPGATGVVGANAPTMASIWTSKDGAIWDADSVDPSGGAAFEVYRAHGGYLAIGQRASLCLLCRGPQTQPKVAWASSDGRAWTSADPGLLHLNLGHGVRFVGDGRRLLEVGPVPGGLGDAVAWSVASQTLDSREWTPIGGTALDASVLAGHMVVGATGVAILPGGVVDTTPGSTHPQPWWGVAASATQATPVPTPRPSTLVTGCDTLGFNARRCAAVVARAREQAGNPSDVDAIVIGPPRLPVGDSFGSHPLATVGLTLVDGTTKTVDFGCFNVGIWSDLACSDDPQVYLVTGVSHDVPSGATPPPSPKPAVVAASAPLVLPVLGVPIDHVGPYEILLGDATLPDGLLSERSGELADARPTDYWIDDGVQIVVRPGKPCLGSACPQIDSIYHTPFHGAEPVHVYLVFDVTELDAPGAVLEVRNVVVR